MQKRSRKSYYYGTTASTVIAMTLLSGQALAAQQAPAGQSSATEPSSVEEVVVTGSRIVREGYEAPTPLTVVGVEQLQQSADSNLLNILNTMPAVTGAATAQSGISGLSPGNAGVQSLNLRSLGTTRVLVLLDGQRSVGAQRDGSVDTASFPSQLIQRVDVVTGGASAVYGSDAVAGVVNFILDRKFTGVKGEVSGGTTVYGDGKNYKVEMSGGFGFGPDDRGHVLLSGKHEFNEGIQGDKAAREGRQVRDWNSIGTLQFANPAYTATNGQPQQLIMDNASQFVISPGGIITAGPLKGTYFGAGGVPAQFKVGTLYNTIAVGGDWRLNDLRPYTTLEPTQGYDSIFTRISYDVTDNINVFVQYSWVQSRVHNAIAPWWVFSTDATAPTIRLDNAYLPASTRAAMVATGITNFRLGSSNIDMEPLDVASHRITNRVIGGVEGSFEAFDSTWRWNANYIYGASKIMTKAPMAPVRARYLEATDAVLNAQGQIVCRVTLTNPASTCKPWNPMGIGVNTPGSPGEVYVNNNGEGGWAHGLIEQTVYSASVTGEPFSLWAGPVSFAASFEHRKDAINIVVDPFSPVGGHYLGNEPALVGQQSVTEGALETIIPLAKGESWAQAWDLSAAIRFTGYELSGYVTTWKLGTTYAPIDDIKLRVTRSRDIRAPNILELFNPGNIQATNAQLIDKQLPGSPTYVVNTTNTTGNTGLLPEKADTTGVGVVLQPRFIAGFTASVDYWKVDLGGAIQNVTTQQVIDLCVTTQPGLCTNLIRNPTTGLITQVVNFPVNLARLDSTGIDVEASYRASLSDIVSDWEGAVSIHGLMTFYLRSFQDNTFAKAQDRVGEAGGGNPPNWKLNMTASYSLDPVTISLTGRAISKTKINATYIECTSGCPTSTTDNTTINKNSVPGVFYMDANFSYRFDIGDSSADAFLSIKNVFDKDPPSPLGLSFLGNLSAPGYDTFGTIFRAGLRFRM